MTIREQIYESKVRVTTSKRYLEDPNERGLEILLKDLDYWDDVEDLLAEYYGGNEEEELEVKILEVEGIDDDRIYKEGSNEIDESFFTTKDAFDEVDEDNHEAFEAYICNYLCNPWDADSRDASKFEERYKGQYYGEEDFAEELMNECYGEEIERVENISPYFYFDLGKFARDLFISDYTYVDNEVCGKRGFVFSDY